MYMHMIYARACGCIDRACTNIIIIYIIHVYVCMIIYLCIH